MNLRSLTDLELGAVAQRLLGDARDGDTPWPAAVVGLAFPTSSIAAVGGAETEAEIIASCNEATVRVLAARGAYVRSNLELVDDLEVDERAAWREFACSVSRPPIDAAEAAGLDDAALRTSALQSLVNERNRADTVAGQEMSSAVAWRTCAYDVLGMDISRTTSISDDILRTRVLEKFAALRTHNAQLQTPAGEGKKTKIREQAVEIDRLRILLAAAPHVAALRIATGSTAPLVSGCRVAVVCSGDGVSPGVDSLCGKVGVLLDVNMHGTASVLFDDSKHGPVNVRVTVLRHESLVMPALDKTSTPCDTEA